MINPLYILRMVTASVVIIFLFVALALFQNPSLLKTNIPAYPDPMPPGHNSVTSIIHNAETSSNHHISVSGAHNAINSTSHDQVTTSIHMPTTSLVHDATLSDNHSPLFSAGGGVNPLYPHQAITSIFPRGYIQ